LATPEDQPTQPVLAVLEGDETGQELLEEALRVLKEVPPPLPVHLWRFDLSLEGRRRSANAVVYEAAQAITQVGFGLKAATVTPTTPGDVGSPNAILREAMGATVILRVGRRLPGIPTYPGVEGPIGVVRMAVGDAYGAREWRESGSHGDEVAYRTERISRRVCRAVAEASFRLASQLGATVFGGPKYTVSTVYEGMLKEELDEASRRYPHVPYEPALIDATYALLLRRSGAPLVIPALNRDGDCLSDLIMPLFGTIAGAESTILATDEEGRTRALLAEAPHGTAPTLFRQNRANPMAMLLALATVLEAMEERWPGLGHYGSRVRQAVLNTVAAGVRTQDLGGDATTTGFTDAVVARLRDLAASPMA
jgi:isocitrate dehydrogenase (NAD+)